MKACEGLVEMCILRGASSLTFDTRMVSLVVDDGLWYIWREVVVYSIADMPGEGHLLELCIGMNHESLYCDPHIVLLCAGLFCSGG